MWQGSYALTLNQWGVGHGGFHSQSLFFQRLQRDPTMRLGDGAMLRIVYDCGSGRRQKPSKALAKAVRRMLDDIPKRSTVDLLVISHFDRDHVNGLDHLAAKLKKKRIDVVRVWAPVLSRVEALYAVTVAAQDGDDLADYAAFLDDPAARLGELFEGAEVSLISPDDGPIPLPAAQGPTDDTPDDQDPGDENVFLEGAPSGPGLVARPAGNMAGEVLWEIQPYVVPSVLDGASAVIKSVGRMLGKPLEDCTLKDLIRLANDPTLRKDFHDAVMAHHRGLASASRTSSARTGSNLSSLCVYSGPASPYDWCHFRKGWLPLSQNPDAVPIAPAWLGTGDAGLRRAQDVDGLRTALTQSRLDRVGVTSAPHHGSHLDSAAPLWDALPNARRVTIEAHNTNGGKGNAHPHTQVLNELTGRGLPFHVCTDGNDFVHRDKRIR